jgi:hypothetical protein
MWKKKEDEKLNFPKGGKHERGLDNRITLKGKYITSDR